MSGLSRLGEEIAREQDALRGHIAARDRLRARLRRAGFDRRRRGRRLAGGLVVAAGCAAAAWLAFATRPSAPALIATVGAQAELAEPGAFLESPVDASLALAFSDGTRVALEPRARLRMLEITGRGAHLSLEGGRARVDVARRPEARWRVSAGPFAIRVTGTRFDVRWDPERDRLQVDLEHGQVEVSGCGLREGQPVRAGQRLIAACRSGRFSITNLEREAASAAAPQATAAEPTAAVTAAVTAPRAEPEPGKVRAARDGQPRGLEPVRASHRDEASPRPGRRSQSASPTPHDQAFEHACRTADAPTLMRLADAARYAGEREREARALSAIRRRFARTPAAAAAAFALGRIAFDERSSFAEAAKWFAAYLREQPRGALVREARGRLLEARIANGEHGAAAELALDYLARHPDGPHAALARSTLQEGR